MDSDLATGLGITAGIIMYLMVFAFVFLVIIATYVLCALPLYHIAKNVGYEKAWFAWIPFCNTYLLFVLPEGRFKLFNKDDVFVMKSRSSAFWLYLLVSLCGGFVISAITGLLSVIPIIGLIMSMVGVILQMAIQVGTYIFLYQVYNDLYRTFNPSASDGTNMALAIISLFVPLVTIVMLWIMRKNQPVYIVDDGTAKNTVDWF